MWDQLSQAELKKNSNALSESCSNPPSGKHTVKKGSQSGSPDEPSRNNHLDAVVVGAALLAAIAFITLVGESLSPKQKTQLTAASMGGAAGLLVGYGVGRIKR